MEKERLDKLINAVDEYFRLTANMIHLSQNILESKDDGTKNALCKKIIAQFSETHLNIAKVSEPLRSMQRMFREYLDNFEELKDKNDEELSEWFLPKARPMTKSHFDLCEVEGLINMPPGDDEDQKALIRRIQTVPFHPLEGIDEHIDQFLAPAINYNYMRFQN